jgi:hypothetical protein
MRDETIKAMIGSTIISVLVLGFVCYWFLVRTPPETPENFSRETRIANAITETPENPSREARIANAIRTANEESNQQSRSNYDDRTVKDLVALTGTVIPKMEKLLSIGKLEMLRMATLAASFFYHAPGKFDLDVRKAALAEGLNNLNKDKLQTTRNLLGEHGTDSDAFCVLSSTLRWFTDQDWKFSNDAFNAALHNITRAKVEKVATLLKEDSQLSDQSALAALLLSSGQDYTENGRFNNHAFNSALDSLNAVDYAGVRKQLSETDKSKAASQAFFILMKPSGR